MPVVETTPRISLNNILLATDFSASSELAIPFVKSLARHYGSTVLIAHVYHPEPIYEIPLDVLPEFAHNRQAAETRMNTFVHVHDFRDLPHKVCVDAGEIWPVLSQIVVKEEIDLIVIGTHGRQGLKDLLLGSVAEEILRCAPCPVLTVGPHIVFAHDTNSGQVRHILFATNFSPASEHVLNYALALATETRAQLTLLHVVEEPTIDVALPYPEVELEKTQQQLRELIPPDVQLACEPEFLVEVGTPGAAILQAAAEKRADLIVMGAHGSSAPHASAHAPWRTAHQVICQAHCPVLTMRN